MARAKTIHYGPDNHAWKGDAAHPNTKRMRARRLYPLTDCVRCGKPGEERHHRDGNPGNNSPENVVSVCRMCHMIIDGRLGKFANSSAHLPKPKKPCIICGRVGRKYCKQRCSACYEHLRTKGYDISPDRVNSSRKREVGPSKPYYIPKAEREKTLQQRAERGA